MIVGIVHLQRKGIAAVASPPRDHRPRAGTRPAHLSDVGIGCNDVWQQLQVQQAPCQALGQLEPQEGRT